MSNFTSFLVYQFKKETFSEKLGFTTNLILNPEVINFFNTKKVLNWNITRNNSSRSSHRIFIEYEDKA